MEYVGVNDTRDRILIVDDSTIILDFLSMLLEKKGYSTFQANSGELALQVVQECKPDLILLDVCMPAMSGFDVLRCLKAESETAAIPVIMISAASDLENQVRGFEHGAVDYVAKPIVREILLVRIKTHLELSCLRKSLEHSRLEKNIAELAQANQVLAKSEQQFRHFVMECPIPIAVSDQYESIKLLNNRFTETFGYSQSDIPTIDAWWQAAYPDPEYRGNARNLWQATLEKIQCSDSSFFPNEEYRITCKNGCCRFVQITATPISFGLLVVFYDVTARNNAETELRETRDYLGNLLDYANAPIIVWDADYRITRFNHAFERLTGRNAAEVIGHGMAWLFPESRREASLEYIRSTTGDRWETVEIAILGADGNERTLLWNSAMLFAPDGATVVATIAQGHDITLRKQREQELHRMQAQVIHHEKMATIGHLAAGVAHEINNPMGFITSNLGTLRKFFTRIQEYLEICEGGGDAASAKSRLKIDYVLNDTYKLIAESLDGALRVKKIVSDLKGLARSDLQLSVRSDVNKILESSLNIVASEIKYAADIERSFSEVPEISCHPQQLGQVFINLLTNAGQALEGHGTISVRTWHENGHICIAIADTGKGIPEEIRSKIFDPFFTTKEIGKGTGLGLSISSEIIRNHGGYISVESETGRGATFTVRIPLEVPADSPGLLSAEYD